MNPKKQLLPLLLLATAAVVPCDGTMDCYFDTANRTHLTELPRVVTCTCALGERETFNVYDNILRQVSKEENYIAGNYRMTFGENQFANTITSGGPRTYPFKLDGRGDSQICANQFPIQSLFPILFERAENPIVCLQYR